MSKAVKETIYMLLIALAIILILAVALYEYLPSKKVISEVVSYSPASKVQEQLQDNIDEVDEDVILTFEEGGYQVTSTDLDKYKNKKEYVPGKANPFQEKTSAVEGNSSSGKSGTSGNTSGGNSTSSGTKSSSSTSGEKNTSTSENSSYIPDKGLK